MESSDISFQSILDNLQVGVFRSSATGRGQILYANAALTKFLGYNGMELTGVKARELFVDQERFDFLFDQAIEQKAVQKQEVLFKHKDRSSLACIISITTIFASKNQPESFDVVIEDISSKRNLENELSESKELFRIVFERSAAAITVTDKNERIVAWNPMAEKILVMSQKDLFNKPVHELYTEEEWRRMRALRIRERGMLADIATQIIRSDGSLLDVNVSISVLKNPQGDIIGSIGILNDITNLKLIEKKLRDSENKMRVILDNSPAAILVSDQQQRIVSWNTFAENLLGMSKKDLNHLPASSLYPPEEWQKIRSENILAKGSKHHMETKVSCKDGRVIDVDLSVNVLRDEQNNFLGSIGIIQDITEQKKFRQMLLVAKLAAEEANSAKSLFLAKMSHEVRTPMNAVIGMLDMTLETKLTDEQRENLKVAKDAADNLLGLLNDILDLSKAEAGKITIEKVELNVHDMVKNVCRGLAVLAEKKQVDLLWNIEDKIPKYLIGDPVRLRQIIINLVNNAIKFTHKGFVRVKVELISLKEKHCELLFIVQDSGIGIPADKHESIFDLFSQADDHTTRKYGGTGLGLAICKKLVEMMDGRIWVESKANEGSQFKFNILFDVAGDQPLLAVVADKASVAGSVSSENLSQSGLRILVAEDNHVNQKIILKILEKKGWKATTAINGKEVLEHLNKQSYDLILMDDQMPEMTGIEATRMIRAEEKQTGSHVLIVAMTANAMAGDKEFYLKQGMDGYVSKPINREQLFAEIDRLIENKNQ
ncbi:MAG: PAS domain S-box protein [Candidatus Omnitrophica bacterium]|nr:PAS domain S-box protein [Candidatus Omnitrophota bacterium]